MAIFRSRSVLPPNQCFLVKVVFSDMLHTQNMRYNDYDRWTMDNNNKNGATAVLNDKKSAYSRGGSGAGSLGGAQQLTGGRGVVAEIFRNLQKPARFSGGGVVAEIFRNLQKPARFSGGGSSRHFSYPISRNRPDSLAGERSLPHIRSSPAIFRNR